MITIFRSVHASFAAFVLVPILALIASYLLASAARGSPDPVVAADHEEVNRAALSLADARRPDLEVSAPAADGPLDHALDVAGPLGRGALGGIAVLAVAWLLARARDRWGWLRRGWAGNLAATAYGALTAFGAVLAVGGSVGVGLTAIGGAMAAGMTLRRDPATVRVVRAAPSGDVVEVPT